MSPPPHAHGRLLPASSQHAHAHRRPPQFPIRHLASEDGLAQVDDLHRVDVGPRPALGQRQSRRESPALGSRVGRLVSLGRVGLRGNEKEPFLALLTWSLFFSSLFAFIIHSSPYIWTSFRRVYIPGWHYCPRDVKYLTRAFHNNNKMWNKDFVLYTRFDDIT